MSESNSNDSSVIQENNISNEEQKQSHKLKLRRLSEQDAEDEHKFTKKPTIREPVHAGYWYSSNPNELKIQINCWLEMAKSEINTIAKLKALIAPHGGYAYSGPTAGWAYRYLKKFQPEGKLKVFLFGPSHYVYLTKCCLSRMKVYETPLGNIQVNREIIEQLRSMGDFEIGDKDSEEEEHSLEMHLPFLAHILGPEKFTLIPVMVGSLETSQQEYYGEILSQFFDQEDVLFIVSTDLCHWGQKYAYTYHNPPDIEIYESIEKLDQKAMEFIELHDIEKYTEYLQETENTICGKHIISILLHCIQKSQNSHMIETKFIRYAQSSLVRDKKDSSTSYGSAIVFLED